MYRIVSSILLLTVFTVPSIALGQNVFDKPLVPCGGVDCNVCDLALLAQNILNAGIYIAIFLSAILFAWAGWKYVTAGGNPGKATDARKIFTNVVIGLVIIIAGWLVVDTVMKTLVNEEATFGPWNRICSVGA